MTAAPAARLDRDEVLDRLDVGRFFAAHVQGVKLNGAVEIHFLCPFHDDKTSSASVNRTSKVWCCLACGAKGTPFDLIMRLNHLDFPAALRYVADFAGVAAAPAPQAKRERRHLDAIPETQPGGFRKIARYEYGAFIKVRYERDGEDGERKTFRWYERDGDGFWEGINKAWPGIYGAKEVDAAKARGAETWLHEGEKAVIAMNAARTQLGRDVVSTCGPGGSGSFGENAAQIADALRGMARVVIVRDRDDAGKRFAIAAVKALRSVVGELRVVETPLDIPKVDAYDHLRAGLELDDFRDVTTEVLQETAPTGSASKNEPPPAIQVGLHLTDWGNAERFVRDHGDVLRYVHGLGCWLVWTGTHWQKDETGEILRRAHRTAAGMLGDAAKIEEDERRKALAKHALRSEAESKLNAMVSVASVQSRVAITQAALDRDPWLLTVQNGTIDLRIPELREHRPEDLITHCLSVPYDIGAQAPRWLAFLDRIFQGDTDLLMFVQKAAGYSLTGCTTEQVLFLLVGPGANGKSTFLEALRALLGDFAPVASFETFLVKKSATIPNDLARLHGARLVSAIEAEGGRRLAEATIKQLTGSDTVTARFLQHEFFDFKPEFKLWLAANHRPTIRGTDAAIWRRVRLVPFNVTIPEGERDPNLGDTLRGELPGILTWAVEGCYLWRTDGLGQAARVKAATAEYRLDMDKLGGFIEECCEIGSDLWVTAADLYRQYVKWSERTGERPITQTALGLLLKERTEGFTPERDRAGRFWRGIALKEVAP